MRDETVNERGEFAVHDFGQLVERQADAVIGDAVLREIVGADFFGAVAGFYLPAILMSISSASGRTATVAAEV